MVSTEEEKNKKTKNNQRKIAMTLIQTVCPNHIAYHAGKQESHSAKIEPLAQVFKKSTTKLKLKPKPKLLRCKNTIHIVTFNIRSLNGVNQLLELTASAAERINIICIQKCSKLEIKYHDTGNR